MKRDSDLHHALQKLLALGRRIPPDVFESLMSVKELGLVKQPDSLLVLVKVHAPFLHAAKRSRRPVARAEPRTKNSRRSARSKAQSRNPTCQTRRSDSWWP